MSNETTRPPRVMWRTAKKKARAFAHIKVALTGSIDTATCNFCGAIHELHAMGRTRHGLLLEAARKHYYRHKLDVIQEND